jgi:hypothetical protein
MKNFNNNSFFTYYRQQLLEKLVSINVNEKKREFINNEIKEVRLIGTLKSFKCDHSGTTIKDMILEWLRIEKEETREMFLDGDNDNLHDNYKITTSLSVTSFAYFIKLLNEAGIFVDKKRGSYLRSIVSCFRTEKGGEISLGSLQSKYYDILPPAQETVLQKLEKLIVTERKKMAKK